MNTTIDQWEVLEAVVELGSFAAAATKMNRSQSTISYAVSRLQDFLIAGEVAAIKRPVGMMPEFFPSLVISIDRREECIRIRGVDKHREM